MLCELLSSTNQKILESCLKALEFFLINNTMAAAIFFEMVDDSVLYYGGVIDKLQALKKNDKNEIVELARRIEDRWINA
jgi:hypothetical protein